MLLLCHDLYGTMSRVHKAPREPLFHEILDYLQGFMTCFHYVSKKLLEIFVKKFPENLFEDNAKNNFPKFNKKINM